MKLPLQSFTLEFWESSSDYLRHGVPWYQWAGWYFTDRAFYLKMKMTADKKLSFARGIYDPFLNKIVIFTNEITASVILAMRGKGGDVHKTTGLQLYFTLVHEMLHKARVAKDLTNAGGHKIDFDKYEKLPESLKDLFDGLLEMEYSHDAFTNHPENRRKPNG